MSAQWASDESNDEDQPETGKRKLSVSAQIAQIASLVGAGFCIYAGYYLLIFKSQSSGGSIADTTWFEVIAHGMGLYFIGKGILVGASTWRLAEIGD